MTVILSIDINFYGVPFIFKAIENFCLLKSSPSLSPSLSPSSLLSLTFNLRNKRDLCCRQKHRLIIIFRKHLEISICFSNLASSLPSYLLLECKLTHEGGKYLFINVGISDLLAIWLLVKFTLFSIRSALHWLFHPLYLFSYTNSIFETS